MAEQRISRIAWAIRGVTALLAVGVWGAYRVALCVIAGLGAAQLIGAVPAALLVLALAAARLSWPIRALAFLTLWLLWRWPWPLALLFAGLRLLLCLPGLATTALARVRHPRPRWPAPGKAGA